MNIFTVSQAAEWLANYCRIVIKDARINICLQRVAYLTANGFMNFISKIVIFDCCVDGNIIALLAQLPNLASLRLASHTGNQEEGVLNE
jgi:hypothetical protein